MPPHPNQRARNTPATEDPTTTEAPTATVEESPPPTLALTSTTLSPEPVDRWITILHSRLKTEYSLEQVNAEAAQIAASHGNDTRVRVVDSDASVHMRDGYWVIILADFDTRADAISWCATFGVSVGECYPRQTLTGER